MAISTMDNLVAALGADASNVRWPVNKASFTPQAANAYTSLWQVAGNPGAGAAPSSGLAGDVPTDATAGSFAFTNPTAPALSYLGRVALAASATGTLFLYDRLWQNSGISATLTTAQTINSVALTRPDANGTGAEAWWQVYVVMGAGTPTITLTYTNPAGTGSRTGTATMVTTSAANRTGPFTLAAGDTGVKSIQTWQSSATMTSGTIGAVIRRLIATFGYTVAGSAQSVDPIRLGMPRVYDDACLEFVWFPNSAGACVVTGMLGIIQG